MSATEELRRTLDDRGVEWTMYDGKSCRDTYYRFGNCDHAVYTEYVDGSKCIQAVWYDLTPEQAIAETLGKQIVRCRDCKHATISTMGVCKYCEMWVLPDVDGYGCDSQVNLPLDFFCAYGKRKEGGDG